MPTIGVAAAPPPVITGSFTGHVEIDGRTYQLVLDIVDSWPVE